MYDLMPAYDNKLLYFASVGESAERHGVVGLLKIDFGKNGREYNSSWHSYQPQLRTREFSRDFDRLIRHLRDGGPRQPFASRSKLDAYCSEAHGKELDKHSRGYMARTGAYSYYFRCHPRANDYDVYAFAFDNRYLLPELAGKHELPRQCLATLPETGELVTISRHENGYKLSPDSTPDPEANRRIADKSNRSKGMTKAQEAAMLAGALRGWDKPEAKPWNYETDGSPRPPPQKSARQGQQR